MMLSCEKELTAEMIINTSLEKAHGGKVNWEKQRTLFYEKQTTLYDSLGTIESCKTQRFSTLLQPEFFSETMWYEGNTHKRIIFKEKQTNLFVNGIPQTNTEDIKKAHNQIMGAHYVLWQPYKLLDNTVSLKLEGKVLLEDGSESYKIKASYPNSDTQWWYYFDVNTWILRENLVKHGSTYSQIKNISHEEQTGLRLNKERESYTIDSLNHQKYLRASYCYDILTLK